MDLAQRVLARLGKGKAGSQKAPSRFRMAAESALKAAKKDDLDGFEKALDAAVRIKLAERGSDE